MVRYKRRKGSEFALCCLNPNKYIGLRKHNSEHQHIDRKPYLKQVYIFSNDLG